MVFITLYPQFVLAKLIRVQFNFLMCLLLQFISCQPLHLLSLRSITPVLIHQKSPYSHKCYLALWSPSALCIFLSHSSLTYTLHYFLLVFLCIHTAPCQTSPTAKCRQILTQHTWLFIIIVIIQLSVTYFTSLHRRKTNSLDNLLKNSKLCNNILIYFI